MPEPFKLDDGVRVRFSQHLNNSVAAVPIAVAAAAPEHNVAVREPAGDLNRRMASDIVQDERETKTWSSSGK
jgi:hypothetical protein